MMHRRRTFQAPRLLAVAAAAAGFLTACPSAVVEPPEGRREGAAGDPTNASHTASGPLQAGVELDLDLAAGEPWEAPLVVEAPSYFELVIEQRSLDVGVFLRDSNGLTLAAADGPSGIGIDERLAAHLPAGTHRIRLEPHRDGPDGGRVRFRVVALRAWGAADERRIDLVRLGQESTHLDASDSQAGWLRALELSQTELAGWRELGDASAIVRTLARLTSLERELGELDQSIAHGREAVTLSLEIDDPNAEAAARYWLAQSLNRAERVDEAREEFARGLRAAERAADPRLMSRFLNWQGRLAIREGDLATARELVVRALELRTAAHDVRGITSMLNNVAVIDQRSGDTRSAIEYFRRSVEVARRLKTPGAELLALSNTAGLLEDRGQWQEALDTLYETLARARAIGDPRSEAETGRVLAGILVKLGEGGRARPLLERALEIERERRDSYYQLTTLLSLGWLHLDRGATEEAQPVLDEAFELSRRQQSVAAEADVLRAMARLRSLAGRPDQALELLARARRLMGDQRPLELAKVLRDVAEIELGRGDAPGAEKALVEAVSILGELEAPELRFAIAYQQARAAQAQSENGRAYELAQFALGIAEALRSSVDDPDLRALFLSRVREAYAFTIDLLLELHREEPNAGWDRRAFATLERARARSLGELLSAASAGADASVDPDLLEAARTALAQVNSARQNLDTALRAAPADDHGERAADLAAARGRLADAERAIRQAAPRYAALRYASPIGVDDVQARLAPDTALLEYHLGSFRSVVFVVTRDRFAAVEVAGEATISPSVAALRDTLVQPTRRAFGQLQQRARRLGALLLEGALETVGDRPRWIVVPDGALSYLPFEILRLPAPPPATTDQYVVERFTLAYAPSAGVLLTLSDPAPWTASSAALVAFADPTPPTAETQRLGTPDWRSRSWPRLPGARHEVSLVADTLPKGAVRSFVDSEASEARLKREPWVATARWIHLAAHALVDEDTPANSAVVLAPDAASGEDGYLTVSEVFALELSAQLVVLSGCETALGRQVRGEGLIGLTRAFLYAGARGVQVSLWKVADDATPALMSSFYTFLRQGHGVAEAMRLAKLQSLADPRRAHPFYWAPFVLIGDGL